MGVHANGDGAAWDSLEALDANQPHGLDYRESVHMAKAVRKRLEQEHSQFADSTVGGIHKPGGCAVLGVEYTDDCTATVAADGTYRARGLVWSYSDTSNFGVLFCNTSAAGTSTAGDFTVLKMHPDLQWAGGDVTWAGAHEFDASVDITGNVAVDGDVSVDGSSSFGGDVFVGGDISVDGDIMFDGSFTPTSCATDFGGFLDEDDLASDATASVASQQSIKAYTDAFVGDSYRLVSLKVGAGAASSVKVYTKYFTGTTDADSETAIAHGVASGLTKILSVTGSVYDSTGSRFSALEARAPAIADRGFSLTWNGTNVYFEGVGDDLQSQDYVLKVEYIL